MKAVAPKPLPRRFHQASWDEPVIFELSQPGARGVLVPQVEPGIAQEVGDVASTLPESLRRKTPPFLRCPRCMCCAITPVSPRRI